MCVCFYSCSYMFLRDKLQKKRNSRLKEQGVSKVSPHLPSPLSQRDNVLRSLQALVSHSRNVEWLVISYLLFSSSYGESSCLEKESGLYLITIGILYLKMQRLSRPSTRVLPVFCAALEFFAWQRICS